MDAVIVESIFLIGLGLSLYLGWNVFQSNGLGRQYFVLFSLGLSLWLFGTVAELQVQPGLVDTFFIQLHLIGIIITVVSLFLFSVRYSLGHSFSRLQIGLISVVPSINVIMIMLNPWLGLFWTGVSDFDSFGLHFSKLEFGTFLVLHSVYSYFLIVCVVMLFLWLVFKQRGKFGLQGFLLSIAVLLPFWSSLLYTLGMFEGLLIIDPTPLILTVTQSLFAIALVKSDFYSVIPGLHTLGWSYISDIIDVGVCITNLDGDIVESNDKFDTEFSEGKSWVNVSDVPILEVGEDELDGELVEYNREYYSVSRQELQDNQGQVVGFVFTVDNVTELMDYQQQVQVLNRFLRHNLRNSLSVVLLSVERFTTVDAKTQEGEELIDRNVNRITNNVNQLLSMSEATGTVQDSVRDSTIVSRDAKTLIESSIQRLSLDISNVEFEYDVPEGLEVSVTQNFEIAIEQVVKNSIDHSIDEENVVISFVAERIESENMCCLRIEDDGPGMQNDAIESFRHELLSEEEDQLKHGVGLGFGLAKWLAIQSDGDFRIDDSVENGAAVEFYLNCS